MYIVSNHTLTALHSPDAYRRGHRRHSIDGELPRTGIPALQQKCSTVAAARGRTHLREYIKQSNQFLQTVRTCLENYDAIEEADKRVMRERWSRKRRRVRPNGRVTRFSMANEPSFGVVETKAELAGGDMKAKGARSR